MDWAKATARWDENHYTPPLQWRWKGGILVSPCPSLRLSVCPSVDRIVSALCLQQYSSDPFHIYTSYQATSEGVSRVMPVWKFKNLKFWRIFLICNFDFVFFWLGIQYDPMVWVLIMTRRGVSSERRRSSCSSLSFGIWCYTIRYLTIFRFWFQVGRRRWRPRGHVPWRRLYRQGAAGQVR